MAAFLGRELADPRDHRIAVLVRHREVRDQHVGPFRSRVAKQIHRRASGIGGSYRGTALFKEKLQNLTRIRIVLDNEDVKTVEPSCGIFLYRDLDRFFNGRPSVERQRYFKSGAVTQAHTLGRHTSAVFGNENICYREPEPEPAAFSDALGIALGILFENVGKLDWVDPLPSVL